MLSDVSLRSSLMAGLTTAALLIGSATPATAAPAPAVKPTTTTGADWKFGARAQVADVAKTIRADVAYAQGFTGKGVGVALIDTGVVPVPGLTSGNVANGPDLSLDSQSAGLIRKDGFGHGTHLAGIIAGRDNTGGTGFRGIAPDARLTSIKVGATDGAVDVSQVLAAIDWVVAHRNDDPANPIRVLNLSYGTDSTLHRDSNPLAAAVENAWKAGIVVVVAAGNTGSAITVPATDSNPIVVGSVDPNGTTDPADDTVSSFSASAGRKVMGLNMAVDVLAPGRSVVSLRSPGSYADTLFPAARQGDRYFTGSGTSQSAAVVSGAIALILQKYPTLTPARVRGLMWGGNMLGIIASKPVSLNLQPIFTTTPGPLNITPIASTGAGSLQAARGTSIITFGPDNVPLTGERDLFGPFSTAKWAAASKAGTSWKGGTWMGNAWTGEGWAASSDGQSNWAGRAWSGRAWSGRAWSDNEWAGRAWSGRAWSGAVTFSNSDWSGAAWSGASWN